MLSMPFAVGVTAALVSPRLRARLDASYRAFCEPSLLEQRVAPIHPAAVSAPRSEAVPGADRDFGHDFQRATPDDLDDPDGTTLATLTMPDLHVPITRRTLRYLRYLTKTDAGRKLFLERHRRAALYRDTITFALREAGIPEDFLWVAAIESGFDPRAVSSAGAAGLWQIMPSTGQAYGLDESDWVDERRNIARSTTAAAAHLRDLYERFHRWDLALAAYNAGYERVVSAMEKVVASRKSTDVAEHPVELGDLAEARALAEETLNYVPQILAFALVATNRSRFGLDTPELGTAFDLGSFRSQRAHACGRLPALRVSPSTCSATITHSFCGTGFRRRVATTWC